MRSRIVSWMLIALVLGFSVSGLWRLRFATDILEVLPSGVPAVEALKVAQAHFDNDRQVVVLLESESEEVAVEDAEELADFLRGRLAPAKILYQSEFEEDPELFAVALADIWRDAPPEAVEELARRTLDRDALAAHLASVMETIRTSFDAEQSTMAAYDPLGFLQHPGLRALADGDAGFQSDDGRARILLISREDVAAGYRDHALWVGEIREAVAAWPGLEELGLTFRLTGGPVFNAEIGAGMERDMTGTIMLTASLVGLLFLLVQRHPGQLVMISGLLGMTFLVTLGVAGWVYGTLNLVSVGFAAILLGLVIDYAVVIARESAGGASARALRRELAPAILWAAATTAAVFGLLMMSTFTGVRQLGGLIVIGLVTGALVMLGLAPLFLRRFPMRKPRVLLGAPFFGVVASGSVVAACVLGSLAVFAWKGAPGVSFDFSMVEPKSSEAAAAFETMQEKFPAWSEKNLQVIATADSWEELRAVADEVEVALAEVRDSGVVESVQWPKEMIPSRANAEANREVIERMVGEREAIVAAMREGGFSEQGVALNAQVLEALAAGETPAPRGTGVSPAASDPTSSDNSNSRDGTDLGELAAMFVSRSSDGKHHLAGSVRTREVVTADGMDALDPLFSEDHTLTGWPVLQGVLLPMVKRDFQVIFLPAAGVLLLLLVFVFRSLRDAAAAIAVLVSALLLLNALVSLTGMSWNFLSGMAIPLIIGTGIDYSIHLIFALRRSGGDFSKVWNGVGKAICFCGLSTAIGFGSLLFASNETLRSMGLLCSLGVLLTTALSVTVLPGLWKRGRG
ncbi:MAG: MMPL family transporter [Luteolibacter sp.]